MDKSKTIKGGVAVLFGDAPAVQKPQLEETTPSEGELLDSIQDEELKEKLRQRQMEGRGQKRGRPKGNKSEEYATVCVKANIEKWKKLEYISLHETLQKKEVLELALNMLIEKYESEKGAIQLKTPSKKGNVFNK